MYISQDTNQPGKQSRLLPPYGWLGFGLIVICWPLNWLLPGLRTSWLFFPLWLGYCLAVDGLVFCRKGTSLLTRSRQRYLGLFLVSAPVWWLFEAFNLRTQNWVYRGAEQFPPLIYFILASVSFSTVIPAVFGTAELVSTFGIIRRARPGLIIQDNKTTTITFFVIGWIMLAFMLAWPLYFFPFLWLSVYFITEPVNVWLGNRSLAEGTRVGDWRVVYSLWAGVLITAFFWEMWNYWAYPKWIYQVPWFNFLHLFEMPLLGYGGYLPFAMELYALYHLLMGFLGDRRTTYIDLG